MIKNESKQKTAEASKDPSKDSSEANPHAMPSISLPKGGGAIKGIDEKLSANPMTGTGALTVPIFTTTSRSDFYPKLSLSYDSGAGNGPFGIGWSLSIPSITRKTDKGLPKYQDAIDSDIFILSRAEDLVPSLIHDGKNWSREMLERSEQNDSYWIRRYRPRIEGLFARIEQWENKETGEKHWRSISKDNVTSLYGSNADSRIADLEDCNRVFKWLLTESFDDKGNIIFYEYKQENQDAINLSLPHEQNRSGSSYAHRYLKCIKYGNRVPYQHDSWLFEIVFDYGEHDPDIPTPDEVYMWACRPDPFSSFRAHFEVRTYRLCQRVLMFHSFKELGVVPCLVRSTDLTYKENAVATYLTSITSTGYIRRSGPADGYDKQSLPPLEITYTEPVIDEEMHFVDPDSVENLPMGLGGTGYQWVDLDSEGIAGVLTEQADAWYYKRNLGNAQFAPTQLVATKPSLANLQGGQQQLLDLAGDGHKYLVQFSNNAPPDQGQVAPGKQQTVFEQWYGPSALVKQPYPTEIVDFEGGPFSVYNWELFFHIPVTIATRLSKNQRFEDARKWFHYIFNPTRPVQLRHHHNVIGMSCHLLPPSRCVSRTP